MTKQEHWISARGCVYNVYYHFVWSTKYRRKVLIGSIKGMVKNHCLTKYITDAAWNKLITATSYKAEWAGKRVELVNPSNTSQICSRCGQLVQKDLSERVHRCPFYGLTLDRDHNAAINILRLGLQSVAKA
ncbi:MAG: RNA-guided endonuclease TnpB family protein [Methanothrix sp.]|nr:RNA-guided endonuclease TnpB family protein [Methanothrix sp.]MDD5767523.1 RNA-guided endonuclease TnpB family protein [Methanothrix sp.]MDI9399987.1 RNA-guided endonuclease TnpB family protein [Euryarchaeota archaeon]